MIRLGNSVKTHARVQRLALLIFALTFLTSPKVMAEETGQSSEIIYLKDTSGKITGPLVSESGKGRVCYSCKNLELSVDGEEVPFELNAIGAGKSQIIAKFSNLEDGRHTSTEQVLNGKGEVEQSSKLLFFVDTAPPSLEFVKPPEKSIPRTQTNFFVKFGDEGSGVPTTIEAMEVETSINEEEPILSEEMKDGDRILVIRKKGNKYWTPGISVKVYVRLEDRAGNAAELNKTYHVVETQEQWDLKEINCSGGPLTKSGVYVLRQIPFPILKIPGSIEIEAETRYKNTEIKVAGFKGDTFDQNIFGAIELISSHPAIEVESLGRAKGSSTLKFRINQREALIKENTLGFATVRYPETIRFDHELYCKGGRAETRLTKMWPEGASQTYTIPVFLNWTGKVEDELIVEDNLLTYLCNCEGPGGVDTSSSWFQLGEQRYWLEKKAEGRYGVSVTTREGYYIWKAALTSSLGRWAGVKQGRLTNEDTCLRKEGEVFVRLSPPVIKDFSYDRDKELFCAEVKDKGTPFSDLVVKLFLSREGRIDAFLDPESGIVVAHYPFPSGMQTATLMVTDLAGQTTSSVCNVFGELPEKQEIEEKPLKYPVTVKTAIDKSEKTPTKVGSYNIQREYLDDYKNGKERVRDCVTTLEIDQKHPYLSCLERAWLLEDKNSDTPSSGPSLDMSDNPSFPEPDPGISEEEKECRKRYSRLHARIPKTNRECKEKWIDTLAPQIIFPRFHAGTGTVTAMIDDHGMPLSELEIDFSIVPFPLDYPYRSLSQGFSFDAENGYFTGEAGQAKERELFEVCIEAEDRAGNRGFAWLDVKAPYRPPDVSLEAGKGKAICSPVGRCYDSSGIDHDKTLLRLDGQRISPLAIDSHQLYDIQYGYSGNPDVIYFGPVAEEGMHWARLQVTDNVGLSSEAAIWFETCIPPHIRDFQALSPAHQSAGAPAFTAVITDAGEDLRKDGLAFEIDGTLVEYSRLTYHQESGYFAVDGPFELSPGRHVARITAVDDHSNWAEESLLFYPGEKIRLPDEGGNLHLKQVTVWELENHNGDGKANPGELVRLFITIENRGNLPFRGVSGRLVSEESLIRVEKNRVDYGDLGPGEEILPVKGFDVRIDEDFLEHTRMDPYDAHFILNLRTKKGKGRDFPLTIPIYRPTLPIGEFSEDAGRGIISLAIDDLPPSTEEQTIEITGTAKSSNSRIETLEVYVNGNAFEADLDRDPGRFSAVVDLEVGPNVIEVHAMGKRGASAFDSTFINRIEPFVPPAINITSPENGDQYVCVPVYLEGTFEDGTSEVDQMYGSMTVQSAPGGYLEGETTSLSIGFDEETGNFYFGGLEGPRSIEFPPEWNIGNMITIELTVTLVTTNGDMVSDTVTFTWGCPS